MTGRRSLPLPALAALLLLFSTFCEAAVPKQPIVFFLGASETAGYGLPSSALAFPYLVARRCGVTARASATPDVPTLLRSPKIPPNSAAIVLTLSFIDAEVPAPIGTVRRWLARYSSAAPTLVMTTPSIGALGMRAPTLAGKQHRLYARLDAAARTDRAVRISMTMPTPRERYLQRDGIHPNARGDRLIARLVESWLQRQGLCNARRASTRTWTIPRYDGFAIYSG
ncbi:MAG: hypothetical protein HKL92_10425 [Candidatus Eremiobacteraeota bacterium]|nr:hypothetical protein [Candidatus Eremiobacteraeota bacterium]